MVIYYFHDREVGFTRRFISLPRCREVGFIQQLYIISTAVRSGLPDGLLLSLIPRHLSVLRVVRWGIPRFMMGIWYGTLLVSE